MTAIEHKEIKGITLKLIWATLSGAVLITAGVCGSYMALKSDLVVNNRVTEVRLGNVENELKIQRQEIDDLKKERAKQ
ncbi:hypothetical protein ACFS5N_16285 [Mucilaginibacter ximonensis]|uniref:TMhelix containing protein n=1 Tax=Mucilaginibacter ximonensis TaxID=538021 RepID=A0ABW5YFI2_9SPHI